MSWIFLIVLLGIVLVYPAYFYMLHEFKVRQKRDHPEIWAVRSNASFSTSLQLAYKALREVRGGGELDGVPLSRAACESHRAATALLYAGMLLFMAFLFMGLYDSVWGGGRR